MPGSSPRPRRRLRAAFSGALVAAIAASPAGAGPVLHEYIEPSAEEDLAVAATTADGRMPAALDTPGGVAPAPPPSRSPLDTSKAYGGSSTPTSADASYRVDANTSRPDSVEYDDPFSPAITPFKRLHAYDAVDERFELVVAPEHRALAAVPSGGDATPLDDQFYADLVVDVPSPGTPVRIPSVGPGTRILAADVQPPIPGYGISTDQADNWFFTAPERKRVRVVLHLAIQRAVFGGQFPDIAWSGELARKVPAVPENVRAAAARAHALIGVSTSQRPLEVVRALVAYFRGFAPSDERPQSRGPDLYEELTRTRKGVCRHRAYAFTITALALGVPTRMVRNEAHAWVEVHDGRLWHRVDLGGAASHLELEHDPNVPQHQPPTDGFEWPVGAESGADLAARALGLPPGGGGRPGGPSPAAAPPGAASVAPLGPADVPEPTRAEDARPRSVVAVALPRGDEVRRGGPLHLEGRVEAGGSSCPHLRVDVALHGPRGARVEAGSLGVSADGRYAGAVTVPFTLDVGAYRVVVSTPGDARCGPGKSE
ncbi:MAG: transglutaminase domain-containing protein [Polyangiaceae bacterium]|nr:transglutaminase domain-containing protein [Polyangiaceae bacterium]